MKIEEILVLYNKVRKAPGPELAQPLHRLKALLINYNACLSR